MARLHTELSDVAKTLQVMEPVPTKHTRGKSVCFTGHLGLPRGEYKKIVEAAGMRFEDRVFWGLDYVCTNSDWNGLAEGAKVSNKFQKAKQYHVKIINESQLLDLLSKTDDS